VAEEERVLGGEIKKEKSEKKGAYLIGRIKER